MTVLETRQNCQIFNFSFFPIPYGNSVYNTYFFSVLGSQNKVLRLFALQQQAFFSKIQRRWSMNGPCSCFSFRINPNPIFKAEKKPSQSRFIFVLNMGNRQLGERMPNGMDLLILGFSRMGPQGSSAHVWRTLKEG